MRRNAIIAIALAAHPAMLFAQVLQVDATRPGPAETSVQQISPPAANPVVPVASEPADFEAPAQLGSKRDSGRAPSQLTKTSESSTSASPQVSSGARDARPPQPLSTPAEGRVAAIDRVVGEDRCDAADAKKRSAATRRACAAVIENRAAQFARAPTVLSPEQKLLLEQQLRDSALGVDGVVRQLARSGHGDSSLESMGVASVVLNAPAEQPAQTKSEEPETIDTNAILLNAIINGLTTVPPQ